MSDDARTLMPLTGQSARPWTFFLLVILLSVPLYVLGAAGGRLPVATFLPISALMAFIPMLAALILVARERGIAGAKSFLSSALDYRRIKSVVWLLAALLIMPAVFLLAFGVLRLEADALPDVKLFPIAETIAFTLMFLFGAIGEELGWQGYAYAGLRKGRSALEVAFVIGGVWALWHVIPFAQMGRSADWIVWQCLGMVAMRVVIVWLFVNAGESVLIAVLFHTMSNMAWGLVQNYGSFYDPFVMFVILALIAMIVVGRWPSHGEFSREWRVADAGAA